LLELHEPSPAADSPGQTIIELPVFAPADSEIRRVAAATGDGPSVQQLSQRDPDFAFELVQFGRQVRITATGTGEKTEPDHCLARLTLSAAGEPLWSRIVLVEEGRCRCFLKPEEIDRLETPPGPAAIRLDSLETSAALLEAGQDAYLPILARLLEHKDSGIRRGAVQVLARLGDSQARRLLEPLADDEDAAVQSAARRALRLWP